MTVRFRSLGALAALGFVFAACGDSEPDRFSLTTPPLPETSAPSSTATPAPDERAPVTATEQRTIQGWSDELRHGDVDGASAYFSVPSRVSNGGPTLLDLTTKAQVKAFNASLPCGAKLLRTRRSVDSFVVGVFELTDRPGSTCDAEKGAQASVAFLIDDDGHIVGWIRADEPSGGGALPEPTPTPTIGGGSTSAA